MTLNLGITYANDPDLRGDLLIYPAGVDVTDPTAVPTTTIQLFNRDGNVGPDGTRRNFTNTVFDDAASDPDPERRPAVQRPVQPEARRSAS